MFNIIIAIVSIALVAAIAVAAIFYGGDAMKSAGAKGDYARLQNEAQQIAAGTQIYIVENAGAIPEGVQDLVDNGYLKSVPPSLTEELDGTQVQWGFGDDFIIQPIESNARCIKINEAAGAKDETIPSCSDAFDPEKPCCTN